MKKRKLSKNSKAIIILISGLIVAAIIPFFTTETPKGFSSSIFAVACAILVSAIAFPQIVVGLSSSHIAKNLGAEFYRNWKHWAFLAFQAIIAVWAIFVEHVKVAGVQPSICYRALLFLIIFDFFYGYYYLEDVRRLIASPKEMLDSYVDRIKKKLEKEPEKGKDAFLAEIDNIGRIARYTTMCYEKEYVLNKIDELLQYITSKEFPSPGNAINMEKEPVLFETGLTQFQFNLWRKLVEYIFDSCTIYNELYSANRDNLREALNILQNAWDSIVKWKKGNYEYQVCIKAIEEVAVFSVQKGYDNCIAKAAAILDNIARESIEKTSEPDHNDWETFIAPLNVASKITDIGIAVAKARRDKLLSQVILYLINYYAKTEGKQKLYLFYVLNLMAYVWDKNTDAVEDLSKKLDEIEEDQIFETVKYGLDYFPRETARIKRFIQAVDKFSKSTSPSSFLQKLVNILTKI